jgi:hypothetical protein
VKNYARVKNVSNTCGDTNKLVPYRDDELYMVQNYLLPGNRIINSLPFPCSDSNSILPLRRSTSVFTIANPKPLDVSPAVGRALSFLNF